MTASNRTTRSRALAAALLALLAAHGQRSRVSRQIGGQAPDTQRGIREFHRRRGLPVLAVIALAPLACFRLRASPAAAAGGGVGQAACCGAAAAGEARNS